MNKNIAIGILVVLVLAAAGGYWVYENKSNELIIIKQEGNSKNKQESPQDFKWTFTSAGEDEASGAPLTRVTLQAGDKTHEIGTYQGSCSEIKASSWGLVQDEQEGVICWWAGGGTELGVFQENGKLVVKKGAIEEGTAEGGGFRGDFKTLLEL